MSAVTSVDVLVIGAGASGIGAAIRLRAAGFEPVVLEKCSRIGGTWRDNVYPGCACDVPSALYSYSFAPNPDWTRAFAGQSEILAYLEGVASRFGVTDCIRTDVEVLRATFEHGEGRWSVETNRGVYRARVLVAAAGPWHEPKIPPIPGLSSFAGRAFHSSRWDASYELRGKRVAVVGSGASAVQIVPEIAPVVARLYLYQRTAQWVLPKPDASVSSRARRLFRAFPGALAALRRGEYRALEALGAGFRHPWLLRQVQAAGAAYLRAVVVDPELRRKLTPNYTLGCKRLLLSNRYYPSLTARNVEVHATSLARIEGSTLIGADGVRSEADALIFSTGFHILDMPIASRLFGTKGKSLAVHWAGSPTAYLGTTVAGYPNLFLLLGPSLGTGHSSAFTILEAQLDYVVRGLSRMRAARLETIDVRPEVLSAYVADVQSALPRTVYARGGCDSYYVDENGKNTFSWPWSTDDLTARVASFDLDAYEVCAPRARERRGS